MCYPIYPFFLLREARDLCAEVTTISHTLGRKGGQEASCAEVSLLLEPRALPPGTENTGVGVPGGAGRHGVPGVVYSGGIPG